MKILTSPKRLLTLLFLSLLACAPAAFSQTHVLMSQVYGGGGNSGATYRYDFVELYNPTSADVDLSTWSLQYASSTGPTVSSGSAYSVLPLSGTVQAGKYFLIRLCVGNNTSTAPDLPVSADFTAPDYMDSAKCQPGLGGASGKVALVSNTTALALPFGTVSGLGGAGCSTVNAAAIVDFVGYGTANCYEGSAPTTTTLTSTTAVIRNASNANTNDNKADFSVVTPNPRNSGTTTVPATTLAIAGAAASPATVTAGNPTTLTVTVTPGSTSTGVSVTADLSSIGGSAAQALTLGSTANTYSYTLNVSGGATAKVYSLPISVTDQQSGTASGNIALTVIAPVTTTDISTIQANRATYLGSQVSFTGVITVVTNTGYYVQTPSATPGSTGDEGILVFSGTGKNPAEAVVGNNVSVTGSLTQYPLPTASHTPSLEVTSAAVTVNSTGNALPAAVVLPAGFPSATGDINQLRQYESMLVTLPSVTAVGGTDASLVEATETTTSTGQFYVVATGTPRPFREPGMDFRDFPSTTCPTFTNCPAASNPTTAAGVARPANLTLYDDNPERLIIESSLGGGTAIDVVAGAVIANPVGVVDYTYSTDYPYGDPARIILTAANHPTVTASPLTVTALPLPSAGQFTVAAFNVERFFDTNAANDLYFNPYTGKTGKSSAVDVTSAAYTRRLQKFSLAVRTVLNNPDIISVEEVENIQVLKDMAAQIDADTTTGTKPGYVAYGTDSTTTFTNDVGGISIGFLVKAGTTNVTKWEQVGTTTLVAAGTSALNDRPSQVLHATINRGNGIKPYPITVISNHLRSLNSVNTATVQSKKELQAEMLATLIQGYQTAGEHVIAVGDMNAFQFSDGYTDTLGTITGNVSPAGTAVQPGKAIVTPAAVNLITTLPAAQQQSYTEWGSAQVLDHAIVTADIAGSSSLAVGHIDADFPVVLYNDATTPAAISDHDPLLAYLAVPAPTPGATLTGTAAFPSTVVGVASNGQAFTLTNSGETTITFTGAVATGDFSASNNCTATLAPGATCAINVVFKPTTTGARTGTLTVTTSTPVAPVALTGTGALAADFSLTDSSNAATTSITVAAGSTATTTLKFTSQNGFTGNIAVACAASSSSAAAGATCTVTSPVTLAAAGTATATVTFTTTARTTASGLGVLPESGMGRMALAMLVVLMAGALFTMRRAGRNVRVGGLLALLFVLALGLGGCGGSGPTTNPNGTPASTYSYTVTATAGSLTHTEAVNVTVQ